MNDDVYLQIRDLAKSHGPSFTLEVASLEVQRGEVLAVVGPNGSGKSTLLRLLAGLETPTRGQIRIGDDQVPADQMSLATRRRLTMVFQHPLLLSGTVRHNLHYGLALRGHQNGAAEKVQAALEDFGLAAIARQATHTLSGGQRQLVAVARALLVEPDLLLLDEPTANLDPASVAVVEQVLARDHMQRGTTMIWSTHNLFQARRVSNRTALLFNGELVEVGPTAEFFNSPGDPRTADFVNGKTVY